MKIAHISDLHGCKEHLEDYKTSMNGAVVEVENTYPNLPYTTKMPAVMQAVPVMVIFLYQIKELKLAGHGINLNYKEPALTKHANSYCWNMVLRNWN